MRNKPTLFIGSSSSALPIVDLFVEALSSHVSCVPWKQAGQFNSEGTNTTFEALRSAAFQFDFALFIICPDDQLHLSGKEPTLWTARDNVIFEAGLFLGSIGNERVFLAQQSTKERLRIPTDLLGTAMPAFEWVENDRVQSLASINKTAIGFKVAIEKQGFLQFHLRLACGWGREPDPDRFEVELEGVRLSEQMHLIQGKNIAIAARLESPTINFEDDLDVVYSMARSRSTRAFGYDFSDTNRGIPKIPHSQKGSIPSPRCIDTAECRSEAVLVPERSSSQRMQNCGHVELQGGSTEKIN